MKVRKIVIPAAGFGTRFLPYTKAIPKEMLPIVDKPVIEYTVEEAIQAGIEDIILVTNYNKRAIEDHFDSANQDLIKNLVDGGKEHLIPMVNKISDAANYIYIRQKGPYGNATPVKLAQSVTNGEPFFVVFGDDLYFAKPKSRMQQMLEVYEKYKSSVLGAVEKPTPTESDRNKYGFIQGEEVEPGVWRVDRLIEKPGPKGIETTNIAINAGYLLTPDIYPFLNNQQPGTGGEMFLPEAIDQMCQTTTVYAKVIENGKYYDTGDKLKYMKTAIELSLDHPDIGSEFREFLKNLSL